MLRSGLKFVVLQAVAEKSIETRIQAYFGIVLQRLRFLEFRVFRVLRVRILLTTDEIDVGHV